MEVRFVTRDVQPNNDDNHEQYFAMELHYKGCACPNNNVKQLQAAFMEHVLGLKKDGDSALLIRKDRTPGYYYFFEVQRKPE